MAYPHLTLEGYRTWVTGQILYTASCPLSIVQQLPTVCAPVSKEPGSHSGIQNPYRGGSGKEDRKWVSLIHKGFLMHPGKESWKTLELASAGPLPVPFEDRASPHPPTFTSSPPSFPGTQSKMRTKGDRRQAVHS